MAKFKFSLDILLKVNKLKKRQVEAEYAKAQKELDKQLSILSGLLDEYQELTANMGHLAAKGTTVNDIRLYSSYFHMLQRRIKYQEQVVAQATKYSDDIKARLTGLIREVNVLSEMKERQYYAYRVEMERRHQKVADEYAGYKIYRQGGLLNGGI